MSDITSISQTLTNFMAAHIELGILLSAFIAFVESLAIVGSIIPGSVMMTLVGILLGSGALPWRITCIAIFIGALIGDYISYYLGLYYQSEITNHRWVKPYKDWILHGEAFIKKHGMSSILIGRFFGPMRSLIPMVAGILDMPPIRFTIAIIPTAALWTIVYLTPGVIIGAISTDISQLQPIHVLLKTISFTVVIALWYAIPTIVRWLKLHISLKRHQYEHTEISHFIKAFISTALVVYLIIAEAYQFDAIVWWNTTIQHMIPAIITAKRIMLANYTEILFNHLGFLIITAIISIGFFKQSRTAAYYILGISLAIYLLTTLTKIALPLGRPENNALSFGYGLPSGHMLLLPALWFICSAIMESISHASGMLMRRAGLVTLCLIALSRLILNAHWFSQLLTTGLFVLAIHHGFLALRPIWHRHFESVTPQPIFIGFTVGMLSMQLSSSLWYKPGTELPPSPINIDQTGIPLTRQGLTGHSSEPINLVWRDSKANIIDNLLENEWEIYIENPSLASRVAALWQHPYLYNPLPIVPPMLSYHAPSIVASKHSSEIIYTIRLWENSGTTLMYLGTISSEIHPEHFWSMHNLTCDETRYDQRKLPMNLLPRYRIRETQQLQSSKQWQPYCWDGRIIEIQD